MSIDDLSTEVLERLKKSRYDQILEKHEGPETWKWDLELRQRPLDTMIYRLEPDYDPIAATPEFMLIGDLWVLLPVSREQHANLTILHHFRSEDQHKLILYIKNVTYDDSPFGSGYVAICDRFENESFYVATLYHEWFIIDYDPSNQLTSEL